MMSFSTSTKILVIFISGIVLLMLLRMHLISKNKEISQITQAIEIGTIDEKEDPYWRSCKDGPQYSLATDKDCAPCIVASKNKLHLVTNMFPMVTAKHLAKVQPKGPDWGFIEEWDKINDEEAFKQRDRELLDVLQMNLNNNLVAAVHILFNNAKVVDYIMSQKLRFTCKLVFHKVNRDPTYEDSLLYISNYLRHRLVVLANQDIYLGKGWNQLDFDRMRKEKIMYALTRHGKKERYCTMPDTCSRLTEYMGSHDAFAFILLRKVKRNDLKQLRQKHDQLGIENVFINFFSEKLRYTVLNPCFILYVYHVHCANVHNKKRQRVNKYSNSGHAHFIDQLYAK